MPFTLTNRINAVKLSQTFFYAERVKRSQDKGNDIINMTLGEDDFATPKHIKKAAIAAINNDITKYTAVDGISPLKQAIANKLEKSLDLKYELDQILVSCGAKQSIYNCLQCVVDNEDEVIISTPYWESYPDMILLANGKPVFIETNIQQGFKIMPKKLKDVITSKTRIIILNSPSNPTGVAYSKEELSTLGKVLLEYPKILIISDDIYESILWNHMPFHNIASACPQLAERTIIINGVSKSYSMTGWRIGYAAGNASIIAAMKKIQSQSTVNPTSISQIAALAAISGDQECIKKLTEHFKSRHDYLFNELNLIPEIHVTSADGAFYLFPYIGEAMKKLDYKSDVSFVNALLDKTGVAVVPGSVFGCNDHMRLSYALNIEILKQAIQCIKTFLSRSV